MLHFLTIEFWLCSWITQNEAERNECAYWQPMKEKAHTSKVLKAHKKTEEIKNSSVYTVQERVGRFQVLFFLLHEGSLTTDVFTNSGVIQDPVTSTVSRTLIKVQS